MIVQATLTLATAIIEVAALSFLGLGSLRPGSHPSGARCWSRRAEPLQTRAPRWPFYPGVAIVMAALGFTLLGEALREALDPEVAVR